MVVKIKKLHNDAIIPKYAKNGDAGLDLTAINYKHFDGCFIYGTGLAVEIPKGHVGLIYPRSSIAGTALYLTNSVGVIDSGYRGELILKFGSDSNYYLDYDNTAKVNADYVGISIGQDLPIYNIGDRIGQLIIIPYPQIEFEEVEELSDTDRGEGGFGSSGN